MKLPLLALLLAFHQGPSDIEFIENDVFAARARAREQGKFILLDFTATWCAPCQIMEESTWKSPDVAEYLSQNCVAVKVNFDDLDGIAYRQFFNVTQVPTLLVLNSCGEEIGRYENMVLPERLLSWLEVYNKPENRGCCYGYAQALPDMNVANWQQVGAPAGKPPGAETPVQPSEPSQDWGNLGKETPLASSPLPSQPAINLEKTQAEELPEKRAIRAVPRINERPNRPNVAPIIPQPKPEMHGPKTPLSDPEPAAPAPTEATKVLETEPVGPIPLAPVPENAEAKAAAPAVEPTGKAYNFLPLDGFSVQVFAGIEESQAWVLRDKLAEVSESPVSVVPPTFVGDKFFRVVVGHFEKKAEAAAFLKKVVPQFGDAFVRKW